MLTQFEIDKIRKQSGLPPLVNGVVQKSLSDKIGLTPTSTVTEPTQPVDKNLGDRTATEILAGVDKIKQSVEQGSQKYKEGAESGNILKATGGLLESALGTASGAIQTGFAPITATVSPIFEKTKELLTPVIRAGNPTLAKIYDTVAPEISKLANEHPEATKNLLDGLNVLLTVAGGKTAGGTIKESLPKELPKLSNVDLNPITAVKKTFEIPMTAQSVDKFVQQTFEKSVKPTIVGRKSIATADRYQRSILDSVKTIAENKNDLSFNTDGVVETGRLPKSLDEFSQAIDQTKKKIYNQYNSLTKEAGGVGAEVDLNPIAGNLDEVINNKALSITHPNAIQYAQEVKDRLAKTGKLDVETAEQVVQNYNESLKAFYRNPSYESATKASIDAGVANGLRKELDSVIENATGEQYQALKNKYASLKTIENDVLKRANIDARKNMKGLIDFSDIFTGGQMITGIATLNPAMFAKGAVERGIKEWYKYLSSPDKGIERLFNKVDKFNQKVGGKTLLTNKNITTPTTNKGTETISNSIPQEKKSSGIIEKIKNTPNKQGGFISANTTPKKIATSIDNEIASNIDSLIEQANKPNKKGQIDFDSMSELEDLKKKVIKGKLTQDERLSYNEIAKKLGREDLIPQFESTIKNTTLEQQAKGMSKDEFINNITKEPLEAGIDRKNLTEAYKIADNQYVLVKKTGKEITAPKEIERADGSIYKTTKKIPELEYRIATFDSSIDNNLYNSFLRAKKSYTKLEDVQSQLEDIWKKANNK